MKTETFLARLNRMLHDKNGGNQSEMARALGVTPQAVQKWLAGQTEPRGKHMRGVADYFGVSESFLRFGGDAQVVEVRQTGTPYTNLPSIHGKPGTLDVLIPQYHGVGGAMGRGILLRDQPGEIHNWEVTADWVTKNVRNFTSIENLAIVTGFGDSMHPMYNPGDPLLVDTGIKTVDFDGVYFFRVGDEGFIKRLQRVPGEGLIAISENKAYRDWTVKAEMDFEVLARVLKTWCGAER
jgi:transcriptional regulator with XRE-family HTH domain